MAITDVESLCRQHRDGGYRVLAVAQLMCPVGDNQRRGAIGHRAADNLSVGQEPCLQAGRCARNVKYQSPAGGVVQVGQQIAIALTAIRPGGHAHTVGRGRFDKQRH